MGASVFYSAPPTTETKAGVVSLDDEISKLDAEIKVSFPLTVLHCFLIFTNLKLIFTLTFEEKCPHFS